MDTHLTENCFKKMGEAIDRIRRHPEKDYGVERLVAETMLSPNTILSRFRKLTGLPPGDGPDAESLARAAP